MNNNQLTLLLGDTLKHRENSNSTQRRKEEDNLRTKPKQC